MDLHCGCYVMIINKAATYETSSVLTVNPQVYLLRQPRGIPGVEKIWIWEGTGEEGGCAGVWQGVRRQMWEALLQKEPESDTGMLSQITSPRASEGGNPFRISFRIGSVVRFRLFLQLRISI